MLNVDIVVGVEIHHNMHYLLLQQQICIICCESLTRKYHNFNTCANSSSQKFYFPFASRGARIKKMSNSNSNVPLALKCNCICTVCVCACINTALLLYSTHTGNHVGQRQLSNYCVIKKKNYTLPPSCLQNCKYMLPMDIVLLNITYIVITIWLLLVWLLSLKD